MNWPSDAARYHKTTDHVVREEACPLMVYLLELFLYTVRATTKAESGTTVNASGPG